MQKRLPARIKRVPQSPVSLWIAENVHPGGLRRALFILFVLPIGLLALSWAMLQVGAVLWWVLDFLNIEQVAA